MELITKMFEVIVGVITNFITALTSSLNGIVSLFYVEETGFTFLGILILVAVGVGLVYWAFRLIRGLISQRRG